MLQIAQGGTELFGRQKVTMANPQFTYQNEYNKGDSQWVEKLEGTGTATHSPTDATVDLTVAAEDDSVIRQTRKYMRYYSGKTLRVIMTFRAASLPENTTFRAGYFDAQNGVFFKRTSAGNFVVLRSGGVDAEVAQANWSGDNLDGTGPSGVTVNFDKVQIFQINLQWLGVGNVALGFEINNGQMITVHTFENVGIKDTTYMRTANLPIRYELVAETGFTGDAYTAKQICAESSIEDGGCCEVSAYQHGIGNGITSKSVSTRAVVLAIRPKEEFNSLENRATVLPSGIDIVTGTNNIYWELVWNPTYAGTPTWTSAGDNSTVEYSVDATTITGGVVIATGYATSGSGNTRAAIARSLSTNYPLALDVDGTNPTSLALVATSFTGTAVVNSAINWQEVY